MGEKPIKSGENYTMVLPVHIGIFEHAVNGIADRNRRKDI